MAEQVIDSAVIKVLLDAAGFDAGKKEVQKGLEKIEATAKKAGEVVDKAAKNAEAGTKATAEKAREAGKAFDAASGKVAGFFQGVITQALQAGTALASFNRWVSTGTELAKLSQRLNSSAQDIDTWGRAFEGAGGKAESFRRILSGFGQAVDQYRLTGGGKGAMIASLGVKVVENGKNRDAMAVLKDTLDKTSKMGEFQQRYVLKQLGFDEESIYVLRHNREEMERLLKVKQKLAYTDEDARRAKDFNKAFKATQEYLQGIASKIWSFVSPALSTMLKGMNEVFDVIADHRDLVEGFAAGLLALSAPKILAGIKALAAAFGLLSWPLVLLGALALIADDLYHFLKGDKSITEELMKAFGASEKDIATFRKGLEGAIDWMKKFAAGVLTFMLDPFGEAKKSWDSIKDWTKESTDKAIEGVKKSWEDFKTWLKSLFDGMGEWIKSTYLYGALEEIHNKLLKPLGEWFGKKFEGVTKPRWNAAGADTVAEASAANPEFANALARAQQVQAGITAGVDTSRMAEWVTGGNRAPNANNNVEASTTVNFNGPVYGSDQVAATITATEAKTFSALDPNSWFANANTGVVR